MIGGLKELPVLFVRDRIATESNRKPVDWSQRQYDEFQIMVWNGIDRTVAPPPRLASVSIYRTNDLFADAVDIAAG